MAELANRLALEADFARALAKISGPHRRELLALMGTPPDVTKVPESFWQKVEDDTSAQVVIFLLLIYAASGEQHVAQLFPKDLLGVAAEPMKSGAEAWSTKRAADLAGQYVKSSRDKLARLPARWYGPDFVVNGPVGQTTGETVPTSMQVMDGVVDIFGPSRDANIATTETTLAATAGFGGAVSEAGKVGIKVKVTWWTEADGRVCPWCSPLHKQEMRHWEQVLSAVPDIPTLIIDEVTANGGPPAHPGCRCWVNAEVVAGVPESFDPSKHPHAPAGSSQGGEFTSTGGGGTVADGSSGAVSSKSGGNRVKSTKQLVQFVDVGYGIGLGLPIKVEDGKDFSIVFGEGGQVSITKPRWADASFVKRRLSRELQRFTSPLEDGTFVRVTNNPEDYQHLEKGTHRGSTNHRDAEHEGGLSVGYEIEFPAKYAYLVRGELIGDGTDGEPLINHTTAKTAGPLMAQKDFEKLFNKNRTAHLKKIGWTPEMVRRAKVSPILMGADEYQSHIAKK